MQGGHERADACIHLGSAKFKVHRHNNIMPMHIMQMNLIRKPFHTEEGKSRSLEILHTEAQFARTGLQVPWDQSASQGCLSVHPIGRGRRGIALIREL